MPREELTNEFFVNKSAHRQQQIYNWVLDEIQKEYTLDFQEWANSNFGYYKFYRIIKKIVASGSLLGFLIKYNFDEFGEETTVENLYTGVVHTIGLDLKGIEEKKREDKKITEKEIKATEEHIDKDIIETTDKEGNKRKGRIERYSYKKNNKTYMLTRVRDIETGRFLKTPEKYKKAKQ